MGAKINLSQEVIIEMCSAFRTGTSIPELMQKHNLSRNKITQTLRDALGEEYRTCALRVLAGTGAKGAPKRKGRSNPHTPEWNAKIAASNRGKRLSEETKQKISEAGRTRFERGTWSKEGHAEAMKKAAQTKQDNGYFELHSQRHSEWMKQHAPMRGRKHTEETRQKMSESRRSFFENGGIPSQLNRVIPPNECLKRSENTKRMWAEGKFSFGDGSVMRSKLEKRIFEQILAVFHDAQHSRWLTVDGTTYVFDAYVPSLKTFIEVNGDYWHLSPRLYEASYFDAHRGITAQEVWDRDENKRAAARSLGYRVVTVWESEALQFDPAIIVPGS